MDLEDKGQRDTTITKTESAEGLEREPSGLTFGKKKKNVSLRQNL